MNFNPLFGGKNDLEKQAEALGNARLRYSSEGRSGNVYFESEEGTFSMWWEFGGGDAVAIINIPAEQYWEAQTGIPVDKRDQVLAYIGAQVVQDQVSGRGRYEIDANFITIFK